MKGTYKHREIYRTLIAEIGDGKFDATQRLPSEVQLVRRFGVSRSTAARAIRDLQSEGVVERRIGAGSFLRKGRIPTNIDASRQLGLLLPGLEVSEILEVLCGELAGLTRANDYSLLWASTAQAMQRADLTVKEADEACQHLIDRSVKGVFFSPFEFAPEMNMVSKRTVERLKRAGIAVVLLDRDFMPFPSRSDLDLIGIDNFAAGHMACEHLIKLGVTRILFITRPFSAPTVPARVAGAREAFLSARLEPPKDFFRIGDATDPTFVRELTADRKIEGIICANDFIAVQLMHSLAKAKIRVPDDLRVIGFDNLKYSELLGVSLTTVAQPYRELAANAMRTMLNRLADPTLPPTALLSNPRLVVRTSCGAFMSHQT